MNERKLRNLERVARDNQVERWAIDAVRVGWQVCACCETAGPPGAVVYSENDGHYLCADSDACLWRFRALMERFHADNGAPLVVYDDSLELPF